MGSSLGVIGLTCSLVGLFFLANSVMFRRRRKVIEMFFGVGQGSLDSIKDYALNKMQVIIGFLFLTAGFFLQAMVYMEHVERDRKLLTLGICGGIVAFALVAYLIGAVYSRRSFRCYLREFFATHPWSFSENMAMTKEIGAFLGIPHTKDTTVESYVFQVRLALGLDPQEPRERIPSRERRGAPRPRDASPMPGL